jgi:hypothetical protein
MVIFGYILAGLVAILTISSLILDHHIKGLREQQKESKRTARRNLLVITLLLFLGTQLVTIVNNVRAAEKQREDRGEIRGLRSQVAELKAMGSTVDARQIKFGLKLQELSMQVATNAGVSPQIRSAILSAQNELTAIDTNILDLPSLTFQLERERALTRLRDSQEVQIPWETNLELFEFGLKTLQSALVEVAKQHGETVYSDFKSLPPLVPPANKRLAQMMGSLKLGWRAQAGSIV